MQQFVPRNTAFYPIQHQQVPPPPFSRIKEPQGNIQQALQLTQKFYFEVDTEDDLQMFLKSEMSLKFQKMLTYEELLNQYDRVLTFDLKDQRLLMHQAVLIEI